MALSIILASKASVVDDWARADTNSLSGRRPHGNGVLQRHGQRWCPDGLLRVSGPRIRSVKEQEIENNG